MLTEVTTKAYKAYVTAIVLIHCQSLGSNNAAVVMCNHEF